MATYEMFNAVTDAIIATLTTNITSLGGTSATPITEGDEEPQRVTVFPSLFVIPLIQSGDKMDWKMGDTAHRFHEFDVTIVGLYKGATVAELLRTTRQYGFVAADLFTGTNQKITGTGGAAIVTGATVQPAYYRVSDKIIHTWSLKLTCKSVTG